MNIFVNQVGKRWFLCRADGVDTEVTYGEGTTPVINNIKSTKAGYPAYDWLPVKRWNITGTGSKKYRSEIIAAVEEYINTPHS